MGGRTVVLVGTDSALSIEVGRAFERLRSSGASEATVVFSKEWTPTTELVEIVVSELKECLDLEDLVLVHPSAAMTFLATTIGLRAPGVAVRSDHSLDGDIATDVTEATASRAVFIMRSGEVTEDFVRRAVGEAKHRVIRRLTLIFDRATVTSGDLVDVLAEELVYAAVKQVGLVHPTQGLETVAATLRLRLPEVDVIIARVPSV